MTNTPDVLKEILARKAEEVAERSQGLDTQTLRKEALAADPPRGFRQALLDAIGQGRRGVIAEIKKASPSKGVLRKDFDPEAIAASYARSGAACLSVLTDEDFFQGHDLNLRLARGACDLPVLRKDFMIDAYQIWESRMLGADCVLLIASVLSDDRMEELHSLARKLGMDVLVEVHSEKELKRALALQPDLIGINNRDLHSFETDIDTTLRLKKLVPESALLVTESGIGTREDVEYMEQHGVHCFLVGESFMRATDPGEKLKELFG
ncbi:MAG: indole-3-glycerol phosphate synthase TrpC [Ectothiorhodospiraceae bacterium]|nr:indole-3-glycerol phosphate synthase TrpC [Ectothiorhodospiraceae bacterium]MCH8504500.1 indole-3-glycerol phosphate synthase TrpC [Ectothiorhodospiraceae bacterium]